MTMRLLVSALMLSTTLLAVPPRVALLYSDHGDSRHKGDYDKTMPRLGWSMTHFENREIGTLVSRLGEFDILLGSALFNYANAQPLGKHGKELLDFVAKGGAIVLTDLNYTQHVNWLRELGKDWAVKLVPQDSKTHATTWQDWGHVFCSLPHKVSLGGTWMGLAAGPAWTVLGKGKDGAATALYRSHGKGFLYLSCHWPQHENMLRNLWHGLQLHRRGLVPHLPSVAALDLGTNELAFSARNTTEIAQTIGIRVRVEQDGSEQAYHRSQVVAAGEDLVFPLVLKVGKRGKYTVSAEFTLGETVIYSGKALAGRIPELLTTRFLHPYPRTKPMLYTEALPKQLVLRNRLHPTPGQSVASLNVQLRLVDAQGVLSQGGVHAWEKPDFDLELEIPRALVPPVHIEQQVTQGKTVVQSSTIPVEIVPPSRPSVIVDSDLALQVNGKPYFPIGVYHVGLKDLPRARKLGFNCFQGWGNSSKQARENLDAAQKNDMMVLLEMSSYLRGKFRPEGLNSLVDEFKKHPALLTWYTVDEPHGDLQLSWAKQAFADIVARDPYHPIYLVMCSPGSFDRFGATTDILAVDPYPIPRQSVRQVTNWMERAQAAVQGSKPIWMIPQVFNWDAYREGKTGRVPTPTELRNMTYQSLVWGAKGVVYFPWSAPRNASGLIHEPALLGCIGKLNAELADLGPQLLAADRKMLATGKDQAFVAASFQLKDRALILAVNLESKPVAISVPVAGATASSRYAAPTATLANGRLSAKIPAFGAAVWEVR